jgi:hypothetical protein
MKHARHVWLVQPSAKKRKRKGVAKAYEGQSRKGMKVNPELCTCVAPACVSHWVPAPAGRPVRPNDGCNMNQPALSCTAQYSHPAALQQNSGKAAAKPGCCDNTQTSNIASPKEQCS